MSYEKCSLKRTIDHIPVKKSGFMTSFYAKSHSMSVFFTNFARFFVEVSPMGKIRRIFLIFFNVFHNKIREFTFNNMNCVEIIGMHQQNASK